MKYNIELDLSIKEALSWLAMAFLFFCPEEYMNQVFLEEVGMLFPFLLAAIGAGSKPAKAMFEKLKGGLKK